MNVKIRRVVISRKFLTHKNVCNETSLCITCTEQHRCHSLLCDWAHFLSHPSSSTICCFHLPEAGKHNNQRWLKLCVNKHQQRRLGSPCEIKNTYFAPDSSVIVFLVDLHSFCIIMAGVQVEAGGSRIKQG